MHAGLIRMYLINSNMIESDIYKLINASRIYFDKKTQCVRNGVVC